MSLTAVHAIITDTCRKNRTDYGALVETFRRIQQEYLTLCEIHGGGSGVELHIKLEVEFPQTHPDGARTPAEVTQRAREARDKNNEHE
jgi:hypothetical protein